MLQPGLYANATITLEQHKDALCLPTTALVRVGEKVFCVQIKDRRASRLSIQVGLGDGTWTEVLSGLGGDEVIVKANAGSIAEGQSVESIEPAKTEAAGVKP